MTRPELLAKIERCDREIESCLAYQQDESNPYSNRVGACMGQVDFMVERRCYLEMLAEMDSAMDEAA